MKKTYLVAVALTAVLAGAPVAQADTIDFSQFGGVVLPSGSTGVTVGGVSFTLTSVDGGGFNILVQGPNFGNWRGQFPTGETVVLGPPTSGPDTITFGSAVTSMTLAAEPDLLGLYTASIRAFDNMGATLDQEFATSVSANHPGSVPRVTVSGADIFKVVITTTNDSDGFFLGGRAPVPGPIAGAGLPGLILAGAGLLALARRRRRQLVA